MHMQLDREDLADLTGFSDRNQRAVEHTNRDVHAGVAADIELLLEIHDTAVAVNKAWADHGIEVHRDVDSMDEVEPCSRWPLRWHQGVAAAVCAYGQARTKAEWRGADPAV